MSEQGKVSVGERRKLEQLQREFDTNGHDVYVLNPKDLTELWLARRMAEGVDRESAEREFGDKARQWRVESLWESLRGAGQSAAANTSTALDAYLLTHLAKDLSQGSGSVLTKYRISNDNGRNYIIFKGNHRARKIITGSRYLARNTKIINMGVGRLGAAKAVASGVRLTVILTVAFRAIDTLMREDATWHYFVGAMSTDLIKVAAAGGAAFAASAWVAGGAAVGAIAVGPLFAAIAVGFAVGFVLERLDEKTGFTRSLIQGLRDAEASVLRDLRELQHQWDWHHRSPEASVQFWMRVFGAQW